MIEICHKSALRIRDRWTNLDLEQQCNPVSAYWTPDPDAAANPKCFRADAALLISGVTNILFDLFVYVLPMPMLWKTQLPRRQRIGLMALFGVGFMYVSLVLFPVLTHPHNPS